MIIMRSNASNSSMKGTPAPVTMQQVKVRVGSFAHLVGIEFSDDNPRRMGPRQQVGCALQSAVFGACRGGGEASGPGLVRVGVASLDCWLSFDALHKLSSTRAHTQTDGSSSDKKHHLQCQF